MIKLHKTKSEMLSLIMKWYDQHKAFEFIGWEDQDKFDAMLQEQYSIDWDLGFQVLPDQNFDKRPKKASVDYNRQSKSQIHGYRDLKHFFTNAGVQRNNRQRLQLRDKWNNEWFPGILKLEKDIQQVQEVAQAVFQLIPFQERYRSDKLQTWHLLETS
tara:strand:+ start:175 stop:648 length:474 start_codon:yes stop_codon:yes gene_type:complete